MGSYSRKDMLGSCALTFIPPQMAGQSQRSTAMFQEVWRKRLYSRESRSRIFRSMNHKAMWPAVCWRHSKRTGPGVRIAFVHATSYADDRQVMQFLGDYFEENGYRSCMRP